jgi:hypothetical protein
MILELSILDYKYFIRYQQVSAELLRIINDQYMVIDFTNEDVYLTQVISGNILLINNSLNNYQQMRLVQGDNLIEFKPLDYKYWFAASRSQWNNQTSRLLVKEYDKNAFQMFSFISDKKYNFNKFIRDKNQYSIGLIPQKAIRGKKIKLILIIQGASKIERVTAKIFGINYVFKENNLLKWEADIVVPKDIPLGNEIIEVFVKDDKGVVVLNEKLVVY